MMVLQENKRLKEVWNRVTLFDHDASEEILLCINNKSSANGR